MAEALLDFRRLAAACGRHPKPDGFRPAYGTAGFRAEGSLLESTLFRCGVLMALRARKVGGATGIVVTASHNPAPDNGVKLVEPTGYMLAQSWEAHADRLANADGPEAVCDVIRNICTAESIPAGPARVLLAHDTRPSCPALVAAAGSGVAAAGGQAELRGLLTTPQLHWAVRRLNQGLPDDEPAYYEALGAAFAQLTAGAPEPAEPLHVDCANGVGAAKLRALAASGHCPALRLSLHNDGGGELNGGCGADAVQKGPAGAPALPVGFEDVPADARCSSIDGDADRVVYFARLAGRFVLLDGDRIAALAAMFVRDVAAALGGGRRVHVGVVQTAYANGSSTRYLTDTLGLEVRLAKTGVKHLHSLAESFDVGIYFEANGHGTVLFAPRLLRELEQAAPGNAAAGELLATAAMANQAVGDAISGILLVEAALRRRAWGLAELAELYADLPSCMLKVKVPDRGRFTTSHAETRVVTPEGLQPRIDAAVAERPQGRAFVRPSGTEDVVRVYAEAGSPEAAQALAQAVAALVRQAAGAA